METVTSLGNVTMNVTNATTSDEIGLLAALHACRLFDFAIEGIVMGLLCVLGFCGNGLSIVCLSKEKSSTATPFLLMSLEAADSLFLVTVAILRVGHTLVDFFNVFDDPHVWNYIGRVTYPFAMVAETTTVYLTLLVTFNRYVSVCKLQAQPRHNYTRTARLQVLAVFAFSLVYNLPRFFEYDIRPRMTATGIEMRLGEAELAQNKAYNIIYANGAYFVVMLLFPLMMLSYLNRQLIVALQEMKQRRARLGNTESRSEEDITRMLVTVVVVFFVCQTPGLITQILARTLPDAYKYCPATFWYYERISDLLIVLNSSVNFIIYCFCNKRFRDNLKGLLCRRQDINENGATDMDTRNAASRRQQQQHQNGSYAAVPTHSTKLPQVQHIDE